MPTSLRRKGEEIIHSVLLEEVISALDEVIYLSRDQLQSMILKQEQAIITNNRNLIA